MFEEAHKGSKLSERGQIPESAPPCHLPKPYVVRRHIAMHEASLLEGFYCIHRLHTGRSQLSQDAR